jgi:predicted HD phosphohydrolase
MTADIVADIARRLDVNGQHRYGLSDINQIQHGLQAAWLAEQAGDPPSLIAAALETTTEYLLGAETVTEVDATDAAFFRRYQDMEPKAKEKLREMLKILDDKDP